MNGMNMVDKIFLLVFLLSALIGLFRGGVRETFSLLSWIAGLAVAATFSHPLAAVFSKMSFFSSSEVSAVSGASSSLDASLASSAGDVSVLMLGVSSLLLFFGTIFSMLVHCVRFRLFGIHYANGISNITRRRSC